VGIGADQAAGKPVQISESGCSDCFCTPTSFFLVLHICYLIFHTLLPELDFRTSNKPLYSLNYATVGFLTGGLVETPVCFAPNKPGI